MSESAGPIFKKFENSRSDGVQVEHLSLLDIEHDRTILTVRAPNSIRKLCTSDRPTRIAIESRVAYLATCSSGMATDL